MDPILRKIYDDKALLRALETFLLAHLQQVAIDNSFTGKSVVGIPEAKQVIDKAFKQLHSVFSLKPKRKKPENQAK